MATSSVEIANMALSMIGQDAIESLDEQDPTAKECKRFYDEARMRALEANDWNFARKRLTLASHSEDPPEGVWAYRYQYPSDAVIIRQLQNPTNLSVLFATLQDNSHLSDAVPFTIEMDATGETKSILTNLDEAVALYTFDQKSVVMLSPHFVFLHSVHLASMIAFAVTGKRTLAETMGKKAAALSFLAPGYNANEGFGEASREAEWVRGR